MKSLTQFLIVVAAAVPAFAQDADSDGASNSLEIQTGFDPADASSTPPASRMIGLNFTKWDLEIPDDWVATQATGYVPQVNWNHTEGRTTDITEALVEAPTPGTVVDSEGNATPLTFSASFFFAGTNHLEGSHIDTLYAGYLFGRKGKEDVNIQISNVPYSNYDVYVYPAGNGLTLAKITLNKDSASPDERIIRPVLFLKDLEYRVERRTLNLTPDRANVLKFSLTGENSFSLYAEQTCGIAAIQIVDRDADADGDDIPDWYELHHGTDAGTANATADTDGDGLSLLGEFAQLTDPFNPDSDADGLSDSVETNTGLYVSLQDTGTDPNFVDSDEDGETDYFELYAFNPSDPNLVDSDGDLVSDEDEREHGLSALDASIKSQPLPQTATTSEFLWETANVQLLRDNEAFGHSRGFSSRNRWVVLFQTQNATDDDTNADFFQYDIRFGLWFKDGKTIPHFYSQKSGAFFRQNRTFLQINGTEDVSAACGFSGVGSADTSDPLTFSVAATKVNGFWDLTLTIRNQETNQEVFRATYDALDAHPSINDGTAQWRQKADVEELGSIVRGRKIQVMLSTRPSNESNFISDEVDANNDGIADAWAATYSITDPLADHDGDGLSNYAEFLAGTHPRKKDTDDDGADDGVELASFTNATDASTQPFFNASDMPVGGDFDGNGLSDLWERSYAPGQILARNADPDGDGYSNYEESIAGTDPLDATSYLSLELTNDGGETRLNWADRPYKSVWLSASDNLNGDFETITGASSGMAMMTDDPRKFYRVNVSDRDRDGDGLTDSEEAILGTNPTSADSAGRPVMRDVNGTPTRILSGDYAYFAERYANNGSLADGSPGDFAMSPREASRFLMQTTFGPLKSNIEELRATGMETWIDDQIHNAPVTSMSKIIDDFYFDLEGGQRRDGYFSTGFSGLNGFFMWGANFESAFARGAIQGEDQLRQRVAFALSQIFVISRQNFNLKGDVRTMASFYDVLVDNAFGNYYDLLREVTRHYAMGIYLSSIANKPPEPENNLYPDENYGREVMQLFSIGIHEMNNDGSFKRDENGLLIETYDQFDVTEMARLMTGLGLESSFGSRHGGNRNRPMRMFANTHDFNEKQIIKRLTIPQKEATAENAEEDLDQALRVLFDHENTPPFVSRALIQFLITDNPSPAYIERVANVFIDDGNGERGNLEAVWKAILLDPEARDVALADTLPQYGRLRDPYIRLMHLARLLRMDRIPEIYLWDYAERIEVAAAQTPLNSPTVFNFYKPDYQPPGPLLDNGFVGGPFEILDTNTATGMPNLIWDTLYDGFKVRTTQGRYHMKPAYDEFLPYVHDADLLLDHINLVACAGRMKAGTRQILKEEIEKVDATLYNDSVSKVCLALYGALIAPESAVQK